MTRLGHYLTALLAGDADAFTLVVERTKGLLAARIEPAFTSKTRNRGLLGRESLDADTAMVIAPSNSIHTFFMRFPIDVIYTDRSGQVRKIRAALGPWRLSGCLGGFAVIEMAAGSAARAGLVVGDRIVCARPQT